LSSNFERGVHILVLEDECATAAEIYQCGQREDAALVNGLILQTKGSSTVKKKNSNKNILNKSTDILGQRTRSEFENPLVQELRIS